jgi:hypothetical protein
MFTTSQAFFHIKPSYRLMLYIVLLHGGAILCLPQLSLAWPIKLFLGAIILFSFFLALKKHIFLKNNYSIVALSHIQQNKWCLQLPQQTIEQANLLTSSTINKYFMILNFEHHHKQCSITLLPDSLEPSRFHQLFFLIKTSQLAKHSVKPLLK